MFEFTHLEFFHKLIEGFEHDIATFALPRPLLSFLIFRRSIMHVCMNGLIKARLNGMKFALYLQGIRKYGMYLSDGNDYCVL